MSRNQGMKTEEDTKAKTDETGENPVMRAVQDDSDFDDLIAASGEIKLLKEAVLSLRSELEHSKENSEDNLHNVESNYREEVVHLKNTVIKLRALLEEHAGK